MNPSLAAYSGAQEFKSDGVERTAWYTSKNKISDRVRKIGMALQVVVDVNTTRKNAFLNGFWKGLGAPSLLYGDTVLDASLADFTPKALPERSYGTTQDDWQRVGLDLEDAIAALRLSHPSSQEAGP